MFKCKECGLEYEVKPEYCDCGNDTFEEIASAPEQKNSSAIEITPEQRPTPKSERTQETATLKNFFDPISTIVFIFCIITSIIVLFFVGNPKEKSEAPKPEQTEVQQANIPDIESFWNNSTVGIINNEKTSKQNTAQTQPVQETSNLQLALTQPKQEQVQKTISFPAPKTTAVEKAQQPITKTQIPAQPAQTQPVATTPAPKIPKKTQEIANQPKTPKATSKPKPKITETNTTPKPAQTQPSQQNQTVKQANDNSSKDIPLRPKANIDPAAQAKELNNYKASLRNTIGRKIDFTKVIGDGDCAISFSIDSSGKLINRKFTKQSSNITLNDAAYKAVMATPKYNPPPSGYKSETLNLQIHFQNGNYNVWLK